MLNHSLNKSLMFFGAGNVMRIWGSKNIRVIRGVSRRLPVSGLLWLLGAVAITGAPPFGLFLSEVVILRAGLSSAHAWAVIVMAVLLIVIFVGFLNHFRALYYAPQEDGCLEEAHDSGTAAPAGFPTIWCTLPMWLAVIPLLALGLWWPDFFTRFFASVASCLGAGGGS